MLSTPPRPDVASPPERKLDPEAVITRIVARLIEELGAVCIAPDSPAWRDLTQSGRRVGELRVYRGRGRVRKIVSSHFTLSEPSIDSHSVAVFTAPESPVPHFVLDSVQVGAKVSFRLDLLPKRDLAVSLPYLDRCFAPLSDLCHELEVDPRFTRAAVPIRQRALCSPWMVLYSLDPQHIDAALGYVQRYFAHWASLLRSDAPELHASPEIAVRDAHHRKLVFSREVDPSWGTLDQALGKDTVDLLLHELADE